MIEISILLLGTLLSPLILQAKDADLSNYYITATCEQEERQSTIDMVNDDFHKRHPEKYRLEITQISEAPIVNEYQGDLVANAVGGLRPNRLLITVFDEATNSIDPKFSVEVDGQATIMSELRYEGTNAYGRVEGQLWLRYGSQTPNIIINGVEIWFNCEGIQMVEREPEAS